VDEVLPPGMQIVVNSGITAGSIAAIVLNVAFNILGGGDESPEPTSVATARTTGDTRGPV
jgi:xanthine/uracil permease